MLSQHNHFVRSSENLLDQGQFVQLIKTRLKECGENSFILNTELDEPTGCWGIIFLAKYRPALFSYITGVIALNNINILSAEIRACWEESLAEIFMVTRVSSSNHPDEIWKQMRSDLENTFTGKLALTYRLNLKLLHPIPSNLSKYSYGQNVVVDNKISDSFTLI
jgi:UTP:GlnB (protein PII) uridylyltransferase